MLAQLSDTMKIILLLGLLATTAWAGPTIYKIDQEEGTAERVMTAVSSTGQSSRDLANISSVFYNFHFAISPYY